MWSKAIQEWKRKPRDLKSCKDFFLFKTWCSTWGTETHISFWFQAKKRLVTAVMSCCRCCCALLYQIQLRLFNNRLNTGMEAKQLIAVINNSCTWISFLRSLFQILSFRKTSVQTCKGLKGLSRLIGSKETVLWWLLWPIFSWLPIKSVQICKDQWFEIIVSRETFSQVYTEYLLHRVSSSDSYNFYVKYRRRVGVKL